LKSFYAEFKFILPWNFCFIAHCNCEGDTPYWYRRGWQ